MRRTKAYSSGILILAGVACAGTGAAVGSSPPASTKVVVLAQDFELTPGQGAVVDGGALTVSFDKVAEDSRCPTGVQCVWAGDGAVALTVSTPGMDKSAASLHTTLENMTGLASGSHVD